MAMLLKPVSRARSRNCRWNGRSGADEITIFDSTGLAVQDLAVAALVYERYRADAGADAFAGVVEIALA